MAGDALRDRGWERTAGLVGMARTTQTLAGACDAVENAALLGVIAGGQSWLPRVARSFAVAKSALLAAGAAYAAGCYGSRR